MTAPVAYVLDVGHGNCAVARDDAHSVVVDTPPTDTLLRTLAQRSVDRVDAVLISHADRDHVAGLPAVLSAKNLVVDAVYLNPDATKPLSRPQQRLITAALEDAIGSGRTRVHLQLNTLFGDTLSAGKVRVEVLAPRWQQARGGVGGTTNTGRRTTSNTLSAVIRVGTPNGRHVLVAGDLDTVGLADLLSAGADLHADVLVFPHHGGGVRGADPGGFARALCHAVGPQTVVFSMGRQPHEHPDPRIVAAVQEEIPTVHIACTQLSRHCAHTLPVQRGDHFSDLPREGLLNGPSCAGSLILPLRVGPVAPTVASHRDYVEQHVPTPMCAPSVVGARA